MDNYYGITLLSSFNKIFEMVIWNRISGWWKDNGIISCLQGTCRKGQSCLHTAFLLQETVSETLDSHKNAFVAFYDVSKAFDSVWTNGLFHKLYDMGIKGRLWRILYRAYQGFECRVRIGGTMPDWYEMKCGIHQGGFLSLLKYIAFINELITNLEKSGLCCDVYGIPSNPPGYADDLATACNSKCKLDKALKVVNDYGNKWRFKFNARKSAVMVYGEERKENRRNSEVRIFKLGDERVKEKVNYDHVGVKVCLFKDDESRVKEKICTGRRALNAAAGLGIRKNGLTIKTCSLIFWTIVVPIAERRIFKLGPDRVKERPSYDHVGVTTCLTESDMSGVEGRLAKARRALNAISGMGIRRNGLSVATCCLIFWVIVALIAFFGCEMLVLNDESIRLFEEFQTYAGKRIQRLFSKTPNTCAFFSLGWIRIERFIEVKKLLFARSILALDEADPSRLIFCKRVNDYLNDRESGQSNPCGSIVFDILNVAADFGVMDEVVNMSRLGHGWSKGVWKKRIWKRAWEMDECYWKIQVMCHRSLDILSNVCGGAKYVVWWAIADTNHQLMKCCETMVRLVTHASLLRTDDVRLKGSTIASRFCVNCDLSAMDDVRHLVLSCPRWQLMRTEMMEEISRIADGSGRAILDSQCDLLYVLLGKPVTGFTFEQMVLVWIIAAKSITKMYNSSTKKGIG